MPAPESHRSAPRLPAHGHVWLQCWRADVERTSNLANGLLDISEGGIQLLSKELLGVGETLAVSLNGSGIRECVRRFGTVRWVVPFGGEACFVGVQFHEPLNVNDVEMLASIAPGPSERDELALEF